jgi:hypothetical protein
MEPTKPQSSKSEDIDLLEVLAKAIQLAKENAFVITVAFFVGTGLGVAYYQLIPNTYESKMLISSDILTESYSQTLMENINRLVDEENIQTLAHKLSVTADQATEIGEIEIKSAIGKPDGTPESGKVYLSVEAESTDNNIWPVLQTALVNYLQNNEYVRIRVEHRKRYTNQVIAKIDLELNDLEALKDKFTQDGFTRSGKESLVVFDPTTINTKILELNKERIGLQNSLETINSIQVVEGFTAFKKPATPKLSLSVLAGSTFGLVLAGLLVLSRAIRSMLKFSATKLAKS